MLLTNENEVLYVCKFVVFLRFFLVFLALSFFSPEFSRFFDASDFALSHQDCVKVLRGDESVDAGQRQVAVLLHMSKITLFSLFVLDNTVVINLYVPVPDIVRDKNIFLFSVLC